MGGGSSGIQMKLVVNLMLGIGMQAVAEAVSLGEHLHLDKTVLLDVLSKTAVMPPALVGKLKKIETDDYSPQFPLRLMSKDMDLIMETARAVGADLAAGCAAKSVLDANLKTNGDLDLSAITPFVFNRASEQPRLRQVPDTDRFCA
jgi:3-hydroxyisobutyrate dehydrogenase-like beta-hydroxyacid dehydrogenase